MYTFPFQRSTALKQYIWSVNFNLRLSIITSIALMTAAAIISKELLKFDGMYNVN